MDSNKDVADNLRQEFVRIKTKKETDREAIVTGMEGRLPSSGGDTRITM